MGIGKIHKRTIFRQHDQASACRPEMVRVYLNRRLRMQKQIIVVLCVVLMIAVIVGVDLLFFRHRFWERLMANIGIVLVFLAFYLRFLRHP